MADIHDDTGSRSDFENRLLELSREIERQSVQVVEEGGAETGALGGAAAPQAAPDDALPQSVMAVQFEKFSREIGETMGQLVEQIKRRNALESANERLFDAMHGELKSYKEATILEAMQKPFLLDLITLKDDLGQVAAQVTSHLDASPEGMKSAAHNLDNALHFIDEILSRHSVEEISIKQELDTRERRTVGTCASGDSSRKPGDIIEVRRVGYRWRGRVLRPVDVVAEA